MVKKSVATENFTHYFPTFDAPWMNNYDFSTCNYGKFDDSLWMFPKVYDESQIKNTDVKTPENTLQLGYYENNTVLPYYSTVYQTEPSGLTEASGIITKYYMLDEKGNKVASFATQKELDEFLDENQDIVGAYTWKAALCTNGNTDDLLDQIMNNHAISSKNATYFIDYDISATYGSKRKIFN